MGWSRRQIQHWIEYAVIRFFMIFLWLLPQNRVYTLANVLGWFLFTVLGIRRRVVMTNLGIAFPDLSEKERRIIGRRSMQNICASMFEFARFPVMRREDMVAALTFDNPKAFDDMVERGKGGVLVSGHFGNWEMLGAVLKLKGYPVSVVVTEQHNAYVDAMISAHREMMGLGIIRRGIAIRGVLRALRNNEMVALLSDQEAREQGIFVDFFSRPSSTHQGPAVFVLKTGAPVIFGRAIRRPRGRHKILMDLLNFDHLHGLTPENIREITQTCSALLEKSIRDYPDQYYWVHRRWKTSPEGGLPNPYE